MAVVLLCSFCSRRLKHGEGFREVRFRCFGLYPRDRRMCSVCDTREREDRLTKLGGDVKPIRYAVVRKALACAALFLALTSTAQHTATVQQRDGIDVYILSTPTAPHDYLGSVRYLGNFLPGYIGRPQHHVAKLVRRAKRKFPAAQGIVVGESDMTRATVIVYQKPPAP